ACRRPRFRGHRLWPSPRRTRVSREQRKRRAHTLYKPQSGFSSPTSYRKGEAATALRRRTIRRFGIENSTAGTEIFAAASAQDPPPALLAGSSHSCTRRADECGPSTSERLAATIYRHLGSLAPFGHTCHARTPSHSVRSKSSVAKGSEHAENQQ